MTIVPMHRRAADKRPSPACPAPDADINIALLKGLNAIADCATWLMRNGYTVEAAVIAHGTLVLRHLGHLVDIRRPVHGPAITLTWRPGMARALGGANIARRPGLDGRPIYIWQADRYGVTMHWISEEDEPCAP